MQPKTKKTRDLSVSPQQLSKTIPNISSQSRTNYDVHVLRSQNTESGEPELKNIGEKYKDNHELILHNTIIFAG